MADIKNPNLIIVKGLLFLLLGVMASAILVCLTGRFDVLVLLFNFDLGILPLFTISLST